MLKCREAVIISTSFSDARPVTQSQQHEDHLQMNQPYASFHRLLQLWLLVHENLH